MSVAQASTGTSSYSGACTADPISLAIIDDHPPIREAIRWQVEETIDLQMVAEADSASEAYRLIEAQPPDVAVVDISLEDGHCFGFIESVRSEHPNTRFLVFSMHDERVYTERALRAGAAGYLMKTCPLDVVLTGVRRVALGEVYLSAQMTDRVLRNKKRGQPEKIDFPLDELTNRELEVFRMLGEGLRPEEIADRLGIARKTVETHRRQAKEKLGYDTVDQVVAHAARWVLGVNTHQGPIRPRATSKPDGCPSFWTS